MPRGLAGVWGGCGGGAGRFSLPPRPEEPFLQELLGYQTRSGLFLGGMLVWMYG